MELNELLGGKYFRPAAAKQETSYNIAMADKGTWVSILDINGSACLYWCSLYFGARYSNTVEARLTIDGEVLPAIVHSYYDYNYAGYRYIVGWLDGSTTAGDKVQVLSPAIYAKKSLKLEVMLTSSSNPTDSSGASVKCAHVLTTLESL